MLTNEVTVNIYLLAFILVLSVFVGFAIRAKVILKYRKKIEELEREILNHCSHILELERETLQMETKIQDIKIPVITMKAPGKRWKPALRHKKYQIFLSGNNFFPRKISNPILLPDCKILFRKNQF